MTKTLRDISTMPVSPEQIAIYQRKISAAGELKTATKRFLDQWEKERQMATAEPYTYAFHAKEQQELKKRVKELRKALEGYLNV